MRYVWLPPLGSLAAVATCVDDFGKILVMSASRILKYPKAAILNETRNRGTHLESINKITQFATMSRVWFDAPY